MAKCFNEKGQALILMCIFTLFIMTILIYGFEKVYKKTQIHINQIENHTFWDKNYEF